MSKFALNDHGQYGLRVKQKQKQSARSKFMLLALGRAGVSATTQDSNNSRPIAKRSTGVY